MTMPKFYNYLTTPSGRYCTLNEITNEKYLTLNKFGESMNIQGFFDTLNFYIKETIPDFDDFNVVDKAYIYIAYQLYSIKPSIKMMDAVNKGVETEVQIASILNIIEEQYDDIEYVCKINDKMSLMIGIPSRVKFELENIEIDYLSGIKSVTMNDEEYKLSSSERDELIDKLPQRVLMDIQQNARLKISKKAKLLFVKEGGEIDLFSSDLFMLVFSMMKESLESFYWRLFVSVQYIKLSHDGFMRMSPLETQLLINNYQQIQEENRKSQQRSSSGVSSYGGVTL